MSNTSKASSALKFRIETICMVDRTIVQTTVKYIRTKTIYAAQRSFKLFAHKNGYTTPRMDKTIMGGYYINAANDDAMIITPMR